MQCSTVQGSAVQGNVEQCMAVYGREGQLMAGQCKTVQGCEGQYRAVQESARKCSAGQCYSRADLLKVISFAHANFLTVNFEQWNGLQIP